MYPYLRLAKVLWRARTRPALELGATSELPMRVWPTDIDIYPEQNNGRHLTLFDLGRYDYAVRCGLYREVRRRKWGFMVAGSSARFRHRLRPLQRYTLSTRLLGHDDRFFYFHQFTHSQRGAHSSALVRGAVIDRQGLVSIAEVGAALGRADWDPPLPAWTRAWIDAEGQRPWPPQELATESAVSGSDGP